MTDAIIPAMDKIKIRIPRKKLAEFCQRNHIRKLAFFGMQEELSKILERKVDLSTPRFLNKYFRERVLSEVVVEYAQV